MPSSIEVHLELCELSCVHKQTNKFNTYTENIISYDEIVWDNW